MQAQPNTFAQGPPDSTPIGPPFGTEPTEVAAGIKQLHDEIRRLRVLVEVADTVTQRLSLDHQLPRLIGLITEALDAERATLFLYDRGTDELFSRVLSGDGVDEIRIPAQLGIAGAVFVAGVAEVIPDAYRDSRFDPDIDRRTGYRTRNILCVPLRNREAQVIGVTEVLNKHSGNFGEEDLHLAEAMTHHAASALEQALLVERIEKTEQVLQRTNRALRTLSRGNEALGRATNEPELLHEMCRVIVEDGGYRLAWIGVPQRDEAKRVLPVAWAGDDVDLLRRGSRMTWADGPHGRGTFARAILSGEPQTSQNIAADATMAPWHEEARRLGVTSAVALPLKEGSEVHSALMIYAAEPGAFDAAELDLLQELANDCAYGIRALRDRSARDQALQRWHAGLEATIGVVASTVEMRDPYTAGHQQRVARLAVAIASELQLPAQQIQGLYLAGIVHDVGKIKVPAEILSRPGQLSELEFALIKTHAQAGYDILKDVDFPWPIAQMVWQHHERLDGSGYPQGLRGDAILEEAKILAVADVVEAMMSHRPYRAGLGIEAALREIENCSGRFYDPAVVGACIALFRRKAFSFQ